jgi:hypothetical protein
MLQVIIRCGGLQRGEIYVAGDNTCNGEEGEELLTPVLHSQRERGANVCEILEKMNQKFKHISAFSF